MISFIASVVTVIISVVGIRLNYIMNNSEKEKLEQLEEYKENLNQILSTPIELKMTNEHFIQESKDAMNRRKRFNVVFGLCILASLPNIIQYIF